MIDAYYSRAMRALTLDDIDACLDVAADREWQTTAEQWRLLLRFGIGYGIDDGGELAGTVTLFPYDGVSFVGMLLIKRRIEGKGWGRRLLEYALDRSASTGAALFATPFGQPLYEKMGFVAGEMLSTHRGAFASSGPTGLPVRSIGEVSQHELASIIEADARAFGTARSPLIRGLASIDAHVAVVHDGDTLSYAMSRRNAGATHIGPIVASSDETAYALVSSLAAHAPRESVVHVFAGKSALRERLLRAGLGLVKELPYMTRGSVPASGAGLYAVAMKATG